MSNPRKLSESLGNGDLESQRSDSDARAQNSDLYLMRFVSDEDKRRSTVHLVDSDSSSSVHRTQKNRKAQYRKLVNKERAECKKEVELLKKQLATVIAASKGPNFPIFNIPPPVLPVSVPPWSYVK